MYKGALYLTFLMKESAAIPRSIPCSLGQRLDLILPRTLVIEQSSPETYLRGDSADKCSCRLQLPVCVRQMYSNYCLFLLKRITVAKNRRARTKFRVTSEGRYRISHPSINFECFSLRTHTSARDLCATLNRGAFNLRSKKRG